MRALRKYYTLPHASKQFRERTFSLRPRPFTFASKSDLKAPLQPATRSAQSSCQLAIVEKLMSIFVCMRVWMLMCVWVEFKFAYRLTFIGDPYALKHAALMQRNIYIHMHMYVCMCISVGWWFVHSCGCVCVRAANACCCGSFTFNEIIRQPTIHGSSSKCQRRIAQLRVCLLSQPPCAA